jgi:hypothetical protein
LSAVSHLVVAGLDPAIHVFVLDVKKEDVDARDKRGHDEEIDMRR